MLTVCSQNCMAARWEGGPTGSDRSRCPSQEGTAWTGQENMAAIVADGGVIEFWM